MRGLLISIRLVFINGFQSSLLYVGKILENYRYRKILVQFFPILAKLERIG